MHKRLLLLSLWPLFLAPVATQAENVKPEAPAMKSIPGGTYQMGSAGKFETSHGIKEFPEEAPVQTVTVKSFKIDVFEVTNREFAKFVKATGYVTYAERETKREDFPEEIRPHLPEGTFQQGSIVFNPPPASGDIGQEGAYRSWWRWDPEANWRQPNGKGSNIEKRGDHPVVCVNHEDAAAYAKWAGKRLPTEAEWEYAARGGLDGKIYNWGDTMKPDDKWMANTFQGDFPAKNTVEDGYAATAPVGKFPANGYGLHDMAGNVWEICSDSFHERRREPSSGSEETSSPNGVSPSASATQVIKGGSFLCHVSYCMRYRPAARTSLDNTSPANHTGFRCVRD